MAAQGHFADVVFDYGKIHVKGGALKKALPMDSMQVRIGQDEGSTTFVRLSVNEPWLIMAVTGQKRNHALGRTTLLTDLHDKVANPSVAEEQAGPAVADQQAGPAVADQQQGPPVAGEARPQLPASAVAGGQEDPMDALEVELDDRPAVETPKKKRRNHRKAPLKCALAVDMPNFPPELWHVHRTTERRTVKLYRVDRKQLWLELKDVPWAIRFLYLQNLHQGVPAVSNDDEGPISSSSASAVAEQQPASVQSSVVAG